MLSYPGIITYLYFALDCGKSFLKNHSLNQIDDNKNEILSLSIQYNTMYDDNDEQQQRHTALLESI